MFAPLIMVFAFGADDQQAFGRRRAAVLLCLRGGDGRLDRLSWIFVAFTGLLDRPGLPGDFDRLCRPQSLWGYTTKKDISGWGSFLIMGLIGLIVASIVNIFLGSPAIMFAISIIGVLIFAGLTAYDTQDIKNEYLAHAHHGDSEWLGKSAIMGALRLYLDFINMFMMLLSLFGNRE